MGVGGATVPDPVKVDTQEVTSVVTKVDSVRVHHGDDLNTQISDISPLPLQLTLNINFSLSSAAILCLETRKSIRPDVNTNDVVTGG